MINKRAISPVVATALLLVVAVVAVVGFQTFFNNYSTGLFSKVETQSETSGVTQIDTIIGGELYFKSGYEEIEIQSVEVNGNDCFVSGTYVEDLSTIPISNCAEVGENDIVVVTNKGIYEKKIYKKDTDYSNPCPTGYVLVPGNLDLGISNFCVMKFEAKNVGGVATSQGALSPWDSINQTNARNNCSALGSNYHLITNAQWMTIARNIEQVSTNWNSSIVGSGFLFSGHNDNSPASDLAVTNESDYYNGTGNSNASGQNQKRILILNNGEIIWDLSGNVWEITNDTIDCSGGYPCVNMPYDSTPGEEWIEFTQVSSYGSFTYDLLRPSNSLWDANYGVGRLFTDVNSAWPISTNHIFLRGGGYSTSTYAGAFTLHLNSGPANVGADTGFRCTYEP